LLLITLLIIAALPAAAQIPSGYSVTCDSGVSFDNGVEVVVNQMRSGFNYTATAIGINGFDPVLAVLDTRTGRGLCSDDAASAGRYSANLPSTGRVSASGLSAQVTFSQNSGQALADVSLVVGGFGNQTGEFILILEGMGVTAADGAGDPFSVNVTPGMVASGVPLTTYMLTRGDGRVDPLMFLAAPGTSSPAIDASGVQIVCDDAGTTSCYGMGTRLDNYNVTIATGTLPGWQYDAMLTTNMSNLQLNPNREDNYLTYYMTSYQNRTQGQYLLVFHMGIADASGGSMGGSTGGSVEQPRGGDGGQPQQQVQIPSGTPSGYSVTCDSGISFDNGVEVIVVQMRSGFSYTATAVGINGFDPVLAVLDTRTGRGLCSDDAASAGRYAANLPTTGRVSASGLSSQVTFSQNSGQALADVSLVVGGFGNQSGEFILILEGMGVTSGDGAGDPFSVNITPGMVNSGVPLTVYMLTRGDGRVDPLMYLAAPGTANIATDRAGVQIVCDDSGTTSCYGSNTRLDNYNVTIATGTLPGWQYDAMLTLPINTLTLSSDRSQNYYTYYMTSYQNRTQGQYLLVFHIGIRD
jgi:hypothetical protein